MKKILTILLVYTTVIGYAQIRITQVVPSTNTISIKNFGGSTVDITNYRLCSDIKYTSNLATGITINSGSLNLTAGSEVEIEVPGGASGSWQDLLVESDLGLYLTSGAFSSTNAMVDFVQWGSGGHGRESVANSKGIWTTGEFVSGDEPYSYAGDGAQNGASFWEGIISNSTPTDISLDNSAVGENLTIGTLLGNLSSTDADGSDTHIYSLVAGTGDADNSSFDISSSTLVTAEVFNHEAKESYSIRIQTDDQNGGTFSEAFSITINDTNDDPTALSMSVQSIGENQVVGTLVGSFVTTDEDDLDTHIYTLIIGTGDTDNTSFNIDGSALNSNEVFDFDVKTSYSIRVKSDDNNGGTIENAFTITIIDDAVNTAPMDIVLSNNMIAENEIIAKVVGTLTSTDINETDTHTYSLIAGDGDTDNSFFQINGDELQTSEILNFEAQDTYSVRIQTNDGNGGIFQKTFSITLTDTNDTPTAIVLSSSSIGENESAGTSVGALTSEDEDSSDTHMYSLVSGTGDTDNSRFAINSTSLETLETFNFEVQDSYSIRVKTVDDTGSSLEQSLIIIVTDENDAPTGIEFTPSIITTIDPIGTLAGCIFVIDEDATDTHTYTLVVGTGDDNNSLFTIQNIDLLTNALLDEVTTPVLHVRMRATDSQGEFTEMNFEIPIDIATGFLENFKNAKIKIYPNPFNEEIVFELSSGLEELKVMIYSSDGSLVHQSKVLNTTDNVSINVESLKPGLYYLKLLHQKDALVNTKVIKQ